MDHKCFWEEALTKEKDTREIFPVDDKLVIFWFFIVLQKRKKSKPQLGCFGIDLLAWRLQYCAGMNHLKFFKKMINFI